MPRTIRTFLGGLLLLLTGVPTPAVRAESSSPAAFRGLEVASLRVEGVPSSLAQQLKGGLALGQGRGGLLGLGGGVIFTPSLLEEDLRRTRLFLARRGYPLAAITPRLSLAGDGARVAVVLVVEASDAVQVHEVVREGFPDEVGSDALAVATALRPGDRFTDPAARRTAEELARVLRRHGYARAEVGLQLEVTGPRRVRLRYRAEPGRAYRFGGLLVEGVSEDLVPVVQRLASPPRGALYSPEEVEDVEWYLRQGDLFRSIRLEALPRQDGTLDLKADLTERPHRRLEMGVGWFSEEKLRVSAAWQHRNLLGGGRGLRVSGMRSDLYTNLGLTTWWPAIWSSPTTLFLGLSHRIEDEPGYYERETRSSLYLVHRPDPKFSRRGGIAVSYVTLDDRTLEAPRTSDPDGLITRVFYVQDRDSRDDPLFPTRGHSDRVDLEATPPDLGSVAHFVRGQVSGAVVRSLADPVQAAARTLVGAGAPYGSSDDLIISERFFAGGSRSMRGFKRHRLGPKDAAGNPVGGRFLFEASTELRLPLYRRLRWALFVDTAQVWRDRSSLLAGGLEWAAGVGLVVKTPVGPIRLDWGHRLGSRDDGEPASVLHFSVGHPF